MKIADQKGVYDIVVVNDDLETAVAQLEGFLYEVFAFHFHLHSPVLFLLISCWISRVQQNFCSQLTRPTASICSS